MVNKRKAEKRASIKVLKRGSRNVIKKGQASSSNPITQKFRSQVKGVFGSAKNRKELEETCALKEFTPKTGINFEDGMDDDISVGGISAFTSHTNRTFDSLLTKCQADSSIQKDLQETFAAVVEIIKAKQGKETEAEYFAAFVYLLDSIDQPERIASILILLSHVLPKISSPMLMKTFSTVSQKLISYLETYGNSEYGHLVRSDIKCLTYFLCAQELAIWQLPITHRMFQGILTFALHNKPKTRKAAQEAVATILKGSQLTEGTNPNEACKSSHPGALLAAQFCNSSLANKKASETMCLHVLGLLNLIIGTFPPAQLKTTCENLLKVMMLGNKIATINCLKVLNSLYNSQSLLTAELNAQLINALYQYQPPILDDQLLPSWLTVQASALLSLHNLQPDLVLGHLAKYFEAATKCWKSPSTDLHNQIVVSLQKLINLCIMPLITKHKDLVESESGKKFMIKIFQSVENCLAMDYQHSWPAVFKMLCHLYEHLGPHFPDITYDCIRTLGEIRDGDALANKTALDQVLGTSIKVLGPRAILKVLPLEMYFDGLRKEFNFPRSWILPLLRDNIKNTELEFFANYFLPMTKTMKNKMEQFKAEGRKAQMKIFEIILSQIWSLLPGFCRSPTDIPESLKKLVPGIGPVLKESAEHRMFILISLKALITQSKESEANKAALAIYSKSFLPVLFNIYTTNLEDNVRTATYEAIAAYLEIAEKNIHQNMYGNIIQKLNAVEKDTFKTGALLDLSRAFIPFIEEDSLIQILTIIKPFIKESKATLQKKSYRILEEVLRCSNCDGFVFKQMESFQELFITSLPVALPSSKAPRLRCLISLVGKLQSPNVEFIKQVLPEAVLSVKEKARKVRQAGYSLVVQAGQAFKRWEGSMAGHNLSSIDQLVVLVLAGLGGSSRNTSTSLLSLAKILAEFNRDISPQAMDSLVNNACLLMKSDSREVIQSCLTFFKVLLVTFTSLELLAYLEKLILALANISTEKMRGFRFKAKEILVKLIRMFGADKVAPLVPASHAKVFNHIRKMEARKARRREGVQEGEDEDDVTLETETIEEDDNYTNYSMQSFEDIIGNLDVDRDEKMTRKTARTIKKAARRNAPKVYLKEGEDIDFEDPSIVNKILTSKPQRPRVVEEETKKELFKTGPDGRLIIDFNDSEDEAKSSRKRKLDDVSEKMSRCSLKSKSNKKKTHLENEYDDSEDDDDDFVSIARTYKTGGTGIHRSFSDTKSSVGSKFKSKKALGDCQKKNTLQPYAYIPLMRSKKGKSSDGKLASIFAGAKKGAKKGMSQKRNQKRK